MGIPGFFKWLTDKDHYPDIARYCVEYEPYYDEYGVYQPVYETEPNPNGIEFDNLYLDMNGIIHSSFNSNNYLKAKNENEIVQSIFDCIDRIFSIVRPRNLLYMAIDGVAPRAKLNQQRSRRFLEIKDTLDKAEEMEKVKSNILANGHFFPGDQNQKEPIEQFDENSITPGTSFMTYLTDCLRYYIYYRMNTNPAWCSIKVILSGANVSGEGEHKIMNYIRRKRAQSSYNPYTHHVIYSPDADLIILGLATHEYYVTIMRDEFNPYKPRFCDICQQPGHEFKECRGIPMEKLDQSRSLASNTVDPIKTNYIFVDLSILRYKLFEFLTNNNQSSFQWEFERFLDDWVFICLLIGNDFLPDLPSFEIYENSIDDLLTIYLQHVPEFNDYLTKSGQLEIELFKRILKAFGKNENENFQKWHRKRQQWQNNSQPSKPQTKPPLNLNEIKAQLEKPILPQFRPPSFQRPSASAMNKPNQTQVTNSSNGQQIEQKKQEKITDSLASTQLEENHDPNDTVRLWEEGWHERYYNNKFKVDKDHLNEYRLQVVEHYTRGLCWILQYYYHGVPSWDWYYPYHYAPFASDFEYLRDIPLEFNENSKPFRPLEQLISLLPPQYANYLPEKWQPLLLKEDSPISEFYPSSFTIDPNGKRYKSQYTAVLPFVDEKRLHEVLEDNYLSLTPEEKKRNEIENDLLFIYSKTSAYTDLRQLLEVNNGQKITYENPLNIPAIIGIPGCIWRDGNDDKVKLIDKSIKAPIPNYRNISDNQVMCVKYRLLILPL